MMLMHSGFDRTVHRSAAAAYTLTEAIALFRRHLFPSLFHAMAPARGASGVAMKAAKEQLGEKEEAECLPEGERTKAKYLGHQGIPQFHDHKAEDSSGNQDHQQNLCDFRCFI